MEGLDHALMIAEACKRVCDSLGVGYVFKGSYDKANRTSADSFRGPGMEEGLRILSEVHRRLGVPVLTDVHETWQVKSVAEAVQIVQIPAFLCRQTDLVVAAASSGRVLNVKKAQFLAPEDMGSVVDKCRRAGNDRVMLCERGSVFGYRQLVVDFRSMPIMREMGCPVVFDATHSVQSMGGLGGRSGGDRRFVRPLLRCAASLGVDAFFLEVHQDPDKAPSDGPNMVPLELFGGLMAEVKGIWDRAMESGFASLDWVEMP